MSQIQNSFHLGLGCKGFEDKDLCLTVKSNEEIKQFRWFDLR